MLWLAIRLPYLQIDTLNNLQSSQPAAIYHSGKRILEANTTALSLGIAPGTSTATARALSNELKLVAERPEAPLDALKSLQLFCYKITPHSQIELPAYLLLEVSTTLAVFDGLQPIMHIIADELHKRQWRFNIGLGLTAQSAVLFSHSDQPPFINPLVTPNNQEHQQQLALLPIVQLRCEQKAIDSLKKIGIQLCGEIFDMPNVDRKRVMSAAFNNYWQQLTPSSNHTRPNYQPPSKFNERIEFLNTIVSSKGLVFPCNRLAQMLSHYLVAIQGRARSIQWYLIDIEGEHTELYVAASEPLQQQTAIIELTRLKLDNVKVRRPIEALILKCDDISFEHSNQNDLFSRNDRHPPSHLLNLLAARLHEHSFFNLEVVDQHQPELGQKAYSAKKVSANKIANQHEAPARPTFLLQKPPQLKTDGDMIIWRSPIKLLQGPERIETGWWFMPINRDYYIGQDKEHRLLWVFFDRLNQHWFLAGVFS